MTIFAIELLWLLGLLSGISNVFASAENAAAGNAEHDLATSYIPSYLSSVVSKNQSEVFLLSSSSLSSSAAAANSSSNLVLQHLNISASFDASNAPVTVISRNLPFAKRGKQQGDPPSFIYSTTRNGSLIVYTGDCRNESAEIWTFQPPSNLKNASDEGSWDRYVVNRSNDSTAALINGPAIHSSMISFPPIQGNSSDIKHYVYGGFCTVDSGNEYWTPPPVFSNNVTSLSIVNKTGDGKKGYQAVTLPDHMGPVAEAGFTFTPLLPLRSHASGSKSGGSVAYEQNSLAIGGYTQKRYSNEREFINISTVAMFSLPEETWGYIDAQTDTESLSKQFNRSDLQPRSGHSAVLSPDGSKIVIVGGWVINTTIAAQPQVAILEIGDNYGGSGAWTWRAAKNSSGIFKDGDGIFGHAATVLPGGSMIIAGGYDIRGKKKSERQRLANRSDAGDRLYVFDIDSESWVPKYDAHEQPKPSKPSEPSNSNDKGGSGPLSTAGQKAALALGIIVGVMLIGIALLLCCLRRRRRSYSKANHGDRELPTSEMSGTRGFEPPAVFAEYRGRMQATPRSGSMTSDWSASDPMHHVPSFVDSDGYSFAPSGPLEVPGVGAGDGRLGLDNNLFISPSTSSGDEHDESHSSPDSPTTLVRGERGALQASEPLLSHGTDGTAKPYGGSSWKGKGKASKDDGGGYRLLPANDGSDYDWLRRTGKLSHYLYSGDHKDGNNGEGNDRTMSDLSEVSGQSHSTAYTQPLFSSRIGGMVAALTSSSDPSFLRRALSRSKYEAIRRPDHHQPNPGRSLQSLSTHQYVSLNKREQGNHRLDVIVTPAPNLAKLKARGRPRGQPEECGQSENIHGIYGNVEQLTGPARKAHHVGEPQSVQPETASVQGLGVSANSLVARSRPGSHSANELNPTKIRERDDGDSGAGAGAGGGGGGVDDDDANAEPSSAQPSHLTPTSAQTRKRESSAHTENSFDSSNYPEDGRIEQAMQRVVINTPSPVRLVISRSGSRKENNPPAGSHDDRVSRSNTRRERQ